MHTRILPTTATIIIPHNITVKAIDRSDGYVSCDSDTNVNEVIGKFLKNLMAKLLICNKYVFYVKLFD